MYSPTYPKACGCGFLCGRNFLIQYALWLLLNLDKQSPGMNAVPLMSFTNLVQWHEADMATAKPPLLIVTSDTSWPYPGPHNITRVHTHIYAMHERKTNTAKQTRANKQPRQ